MKKISLIVVMIFIFMSATKCSISNNQKIDYNPHRHLSAAEEWSPHTKVAEWWYATGVINDTEGNKYFYQFTIFHTFKGIFEGYALHMGFTDYATGEHIFEEAVSLTGSTVYGNMKETVFKDSFIRLEGDRMYIKADGDKIDYSFALDINKPAVWQADESGIIVMGHPADPEERSFYYSFTDMSTSGSLTFTNKAGETKTIEVSGQSWFDRQWGTFSETLWDWFSLRMNDGTEIMLFSFPRTKYIDATFITKDGKVEYFDDFTLQKEEFFVTKENFKFCTSWKVKLPMYDDYIYVKALNDDEVNRNDTGPTYWEGACDVLDANGVKIGEAAVETTAGDDDD